MPVLIASGLSDMGDVGDADGRVEFLEKPYDGAILARRIRAMLDA